MMSVWQKVGNLALKLKNTSVTKHFHLFLDKCNPACTKPNQECVDTNCVCVKDFKMDQNDVCVAEEGTKTCIKSSKQGRWFLLK